MFPVTTDAILSYADLRWLIPDTQESIASLSGEEIRFSLHCACGLAVLYVLLRPLTADVNARSWLLTALSSPLVVIASLHALPSVVYSNWSPAILTLETDLHRNSMLFFLAFLVCDLGIGAIDYPHKVDLLTGWIHHPIYFLLVLRTLRTHTSTALCAFFIEEVPTVVMAFGRVGLWRSDLLFGISYLIFRVVWQAYGAFMVIMSPLKAMNDFSIPMIGVLVLHCYWFRSWLTYVTKRKSKRFDPAKISASKTGSPTKPSSPMKKKQ